MQAMSTNFPSRSERSDLIVRRSVINEELLTTFVPTSSASILQSPATTLTTRRYPGSQKPPSSRLFLLTMPDAPHLISSYVVCGRRKKMRSGAKDAVGARLSAATVVKETDLEVSVLIGAMDGPLGEAAVPKQMHTKQTDAKPSQNGNETTASRPWPRICSPRMTAAACRHRPGASVSESANGIVTGIETAAATMTVLVGAIQIMIASVVIAMRSERGSIDAALIETRMTSCPTVMVPQPPDDDVPMMRMIIPGGIPEIQRYDLP
jgi:hypothetical protein